MQLACAKASNMTETADTTIATGLNFEHQELGPEARDVMAMVVLNCLVNWQHRKRWKGQYQGIYQVRC
jgi:hypothetical protein